MVHLLVGVVICFDIEASIVFGFFQSPGPGYSTSPVVWCYLIIPLSYLSARFMASIL
ncbi:hypothetical protein F5Y13DRAFT_171006 [Hypoxylon sp. FL1857]|nr:hypothetical protein F5Y13DRAFT_171006 [Hypoxylon sp. FL1857]